jgi:hypothetical protein
LIISSTVLPVISDGNFGEPATGATAVLVPLLEGTTRVVCVVVAELVAGAVVEVEDGRPEQQQYFLQKEKKKL